MRGFMTTSTARALPSLVRLTLLAAAFANAALTLAVGCGDDGGNSGDGFGDDDDDDGGASSPEPGPSCDLQADKWYTDCDSGCGDVMACQSFCSDCEFRCMVPCVDSSDCEAVGAGSCEESTYGSNRCSAAPTKCPGDGGSGSSSSGGGACVEVGEGCSINGDCCDFNAGDALCVTYGDYGALCGGTCNVAGDCVSGCCVGTDGPSSVCAPAEFCSSN
jgi:hypothetical protein